MQNTDIRTEWVSIPLPSGDRFDAYRASPAGGSRGNIVMLQEIFGVNSAMQRKAEHFAAKGYTVILPDLFWRLGRKIDLGYWEEDRKQGFALMQKFDQAQGADDILAALGWLKSREPIGRPAIIGFCLGGRMAVLAASKSADVGAVISFYGVKLDECGDQIRALSVPFQFHVGDDDAHIPLASVEKIKAAAKDASDAEIFVYPGAKHGFFNRERADVYDADAASLAEQRAIALLDRTIQAAAA